MVIDACMFSGELDMLEFRLKVLWDVVDRFLVVEGDRTFTGEPRFGPVLQGERFAWAQKKLYSIITPLHGDDVWKRERFQRNSIRGYLRVFDRTDIVILSDVDEIPSRESVERVKQITLQSPRSCLQSAFMYNMKFKGPDDWHGSIFATVEQVVTQWPQPLRDRRGGWPSIQNAGWHFTYFGGVKAIQKKVQSYSHQEFNTPEFMDEKYLTDCISTGKNFLGRGGNITVVGPEFFPDYVVENAKPYGWL